MARPEPVPGFSLPAKIGCAFLAVFFIGGAVLSIYAILFGPPSGETETTTTRRTGAQTLEAQFQAGIQGNMSCPQLYQIRNKLKRGKPESYQERLNEQLRRVGCNHSEAQRAAKPPIQKKLTYEDIDPEVKYADCGELRNHAKKFYSVLKKSGMRTATPESINRNRAQLKKWHEEFYAMDIPDAKGALEHPAELLYLVAAQYGTAASAIDMGDPSPISISVQLDVCREMLEEMETAFAAAGCPLN